MAYSSFSEHDRQRRKLLHEISIPKSPARKCTYVSLAAIQSPFQWTCIPCRGIGQSFDPDYCLSVVFIRMSHSKKRSAEGEQGRRGELAETNELDELEFEDPYGDDIEEDEEDEEIVDGEEQEGDAEASEPAATTGPPQVVKQVWRSGVQKLEDIEELEYDPSAYIMYHSMQTEWPCLSFDFLKDDLGDTRHRVSCSAWML